MYAPPINPRHLPTLDELSGWRGILAAYALVPVFPLLLWVSTHPLTGAISVTILVGLFVVGRRALQLVNCLHDHGEISFDLSERVQITITQTSVDDSA